MRKVTINIILGIAIFCFWPSTVFADDPSINLGVKFRLNNLAIDISNNSVLFNDADDVQLLVGPSLKLSYRNFFGGITWLQTTDRYSFDFDSLTQNEEGHIDISMSDLDALVGYMFHPRFSIMIGYKSITGRSTPYFDHRFDLSIKGPALGLTGNYPFGDSPLLLFVNLSYMANLEYSFLESQKDSEQDMDGYSVEIGLTYSGSKKLPFSFGLKHQELESDRQESWSSMSLTFSVDYRF